MADDYTPSEAEEWELVDLLGTIIEDVDDEPQFTVSEHALMAAGTIRREWLAAHDAQVRRDAARETLDGLIADTAIDVRLGTEGNDPQRVQDAEAVIDAAQVYRDTEYPEETP